MSLPARPDVLDPKTSNDKSSTSAAFKKHQQAPHKPGGTAITAVDRAAAVDAFSKHHPFSENSRKLSNWASAGARGDFAGCGFMVFDATLEPFFKGLFVEAKALSQAEFSRIDLFHGHVMWHETDGLLVIFHAKEYPKDLADTAAKSALGLQIDSAAKAFSSTDPIYRKRNIRYDLKSHTMAVVDKNLGRAYTLDESYGGKASELFSINYFPNEYQSPIDVVFTA